MRRLLAGSLFGRNCWISMVIACPHFLELSPISLNKLIMIILPVMYRLHHMFLTFPKKDPKRNAGRIPHVYDFSPAIRCCCAPVFNSYHSLHLDSLSKSHRSQLSCQFKLTWHPLLQYRKPWLCNVTAEQNHWWQPHVATIVTIVFFPFSIGCYLKMQKKMVKSFIMFLSWNGHKIRVNPATAAPFTTSMAPSRAASLASCSGNPIRPRLGQPVEVPLADTSWHIPWTRATTGEKRVSLTSLSADRSPSRRSAPASAWAAQGPCVAVLWRQGHPHLVGDIRQGLHSLIDKLRQFRSTSSGNPKRRSFLVSFFWSCHGK